MLKKSSKIRKEEIANFFDKGYLVIDQAVPKSDLLAFKKCLWQNIQTALNRYNVPLPNIKFTSLEEKCDVGLIELRKANPDYPLFVQASISRSPEYYRLCSTPKIMRYIRKLIAPAAKYSSLYLTNNGIIFTNPHDFLNKRSSNIEIGWHKDTFYTLPKSHFLHVWMPLLHDATESIGTLQLCPGSHKEGLGEQEIDPLAPYDHRYTVDPLTVNNYQPISVEIKLGQALIFDGRMLHRSGKNTSNHVRCTLIGLHHTPSAPGFEPLSVSYGYPQQKTPEAYFYEIFKDEKALSIIDEQAMPE